MTAVSFFADVARTGTIAGLGLGSSAAQIREALGDQFLEDRRKKSLRFDYGLLEFNLFSGVCEGIAVQIHRLAQGLDDLIPEVLIPTLTELSTTMSFEMFRAEVERGDDCSVEELPPQTGYRCYRVKNSPAEIYAVDETYGDDEDMAPGDLWSIMISGAP
jgi:hypothetical protein